MLIYEIKNAVCSKRMLLSQAFVFLCFLVGGADILFRYSEGIDFTYIFFHSISCGASSLVALIYPVFACMPYSGRYETERGSGYLLFQRMKMRRSRYILSKLLTCSVSGGLAVSLPLAVFLMICVKMKGTVLINGGIQYIVHGTGFYQQHPVLYCLGYVGNAFWCGMIFSLMGMALSMFFRNQYLILFLPLILYIFLNILFSGIFINLNPTLWWDINLYAESDPLLVMVVKAAAVLLSSLIIIVGVVKNDKE